MRIRRWSTRRRPTRTRCSRCSPTTAPSLLHQRPRARDQAGSLPAEVHLIRFPDRDAYAAFLADDRREALLHEHGEVFTSKVVVELDTVVEP